MSALGVQHTRSSRPALHHRLRPHGERDLAVRIRFAEQTPPRDRDQPRSLTLDRVARSCSPPKNAIGRESLLAMARADNRVVAGAEVGAAAQGGCDRWSDLDLAFGLGDGARAVDVFADWTADLGERYGAIQLFDLPFASSLFRVFLFSGCLQVDLSLTPGATFGALGPKFKLLFGSATEGQTPTP